MTNFGDDEADETIDADADALAELKRRAVDPQVLAAVDAELEDRTLGDHTESDDPSSTEPTTTVTAANDIQSAAAAFVAEARQRQAEAVDTGETPSTRRRPSGAVLVLAVVIAAQILAGGVYFALRALADDPAPDELVAVTDDAPIEVPTPTPRPSVDPTATPLPSPTPVPPTPSWVPSAGGPRWAPFTFVVSPKTSSPVFHVEPNGEEFEPLIGERRLTNPWPSGAPLRFRVISGDPETDWAQISLPTQSGETAWVLSSDFDWTSSNRLVQIDVLANEIRVFEGNDAIFVASVATGRRSDPTPQLQSWVVENPAGDEVDDAAPVLVLAPAADGDGLRVVPASDDSVLGEYVTDGDILIAGSEARQLARIIDAGAKVEVVGLPAVPTPTPRPTPTASANSEPAPEAAPRDPGCPRGANGSPPNCYQVIAPERVPGRCEGSGILLQGSCMLLYGDPDFDGITSQCPPQASRQIDGRCYASLGPPPPRLGACPANAERVGDECRVPVP